MISRIICIVLTVWASVQHPDACQIWGRRKQYLGQHGQGGKRIIYPKLGPAGTGQSNPDLGVDRCQQLRVLMEKWGNCQQARYNHRPLGNGGSFWISLFPLIRKAFRRRSSILPKGHWSPNFGEQSGFRHCDHRRIGRRTSSDGETHSLYFSRQCLPGGCSRTSDIGGRTILICRQARELLQGDHGVGRVIARPFIGQREIFNVRPTGVILPLKPPRPTLLNAIQRQAIRSFQWGK